jgi:hypothetical protein
LPQLVCILNRESAIFAASQSTENAVNEFDHDGTASGLWV